MNFVLDEAINFVVNEKTKEYLKEVISDYYNNNYRSCIVTLYTTVIFDFVDKLVKLRDLYSDTNVKNFLTEIEIMKDTNDTYSKVESKILEAIEQTKLLSVIELDQVEALKNARNNAAHPVFKNNFELIQPTKEQSLAHLRNMFDAVFTRDIVLSKKILDDFRMDICDFYSRQPYLDNYSVFLYNRYYKRLNDETKKYLFQEIWKFAFWFDNDNDCNENRKVLVTTLLEFVKWNKRLFLDYFKQNSEFLCKKIDIQPIDKSFDGYDFYRSSCKSLIIFLNENPEFYSMFPDDIKVEISNVCMNCPNACLNSEFLFANEKDYFMAIFSCIEKLGIKNPCINHYTLIEKYEKYKDIIGSDIRCYINRYYSNNTDSSVYTDDFDYIIRIYKELLSEILNDYTEDDLMDLLNLIGNRSNYKSANTNSIFKNQVNDIIKNNNFNIDTKEYSIMWGL